MTTNGRRLLKLLESRIKNLLDPPPILDEQRVSDEQRADRKEEQRVINESPIIMLPRITNAPPITLTRNPTAKCNLQATPCLH